jgi:hypothetical protein
MAKAKRGFPTTEKELMTLGARINEIWHIAVYKDDEGFLHPGIWEMHPTISGTPRVIPVLTYDGKTIKTEEECDCFVRNVLKKQMLTDFSAEKHNVPKDAFAFLKYSENKTL